MIRIDGDDAVVQCADLEADAGESPNDLLGPGDGFNFLRARVVV